MSFYAMYPPVSGGSNLSIGVNGAPAPMESTEVGGINPMGNLQPLQTDSSGNLLVSVASEPGAPFHVIVDSSALPTGAATSANQTTEITELTGIHSDTTAINGKTPALGQALEAASVPVVIASDQIVPVSATALPLPTGAATSANQTNASQKTQIVDGSGNVIASTSNALNVDVTNFPATTTVVQPTAANLNATIAPLTNSSVVKAQLQDNAGNALSSTTGALNVNVQNTIPISGTVAVTQSTTPWVDNISQFGGSNVVTGTGVSGAGIPRVTVASDSSITANAGTNLNTSALALDTSVNGILVTQGSTTSGEKGPLIQGAVTTAAPTYSNAQTSPLSLTTAGALRVDGSGSTPAASSGRALANAPTVTTYGTPITSAAYTTIIASTTSATNLVELFDSSGVALFFAVGAAAAEVNQFVIYPGGNGQVPLKIPAGSRISYKAVSTSATGASAFNVLNLYT